MEKGSERSRSREVPFVPWIRERDLSLSNYGSIWLFWGKVSSVNHSITLYSTSSSFHTFFYHSQAKGEVRNTRPVVKERKARMDNRQVGNQGGTGQLFCLSLQFFRKGLHLCFNGWPSLEANRPSDKAFTRTIKRMVRIGFPLRERSNGCLQLNALDRMLERPSVAGISTSFLDGRTSRMNDRGSDKSGIQKLESISRSDAYPLPTNHSLSIFLVKDLACLRGGDSRELDPVDWVRWERDGWRGINLFQIPDMKEKVKKRTIVRRFLLYRTPPDLAKEEFDFASFS